MRLIEDILKRIRRMKMPTSMMCSEELLKEYNTAISVLYKESTGFDEEDIYIWPIVRHLESVVAKM